MAQTFSSYLQKKAEPELAVPKNTQAPLKHYEMWANYDKMIAKLDEDAVNDLNIDLMQVIGGAVKAYRTKQSKTD